MTTPDDRLGVQGVPAADLDDDRLLRELEDEYLRRRPQREAWPERTA